MFPLNISMLIKCCFFKGFFFPFVLQYGIISGKTILNNYLIEMFPHNIWSLAEILKPFKKLFRCRIQIFSCRKNRYIFNETKTSKHTLDISHFTN